MIKNKKGQTIVVLLMISILIFITGMILVQPLKEGIAQARNTTQLNASNPNISTVNKATVIVLDIGIFYFIGIVIASSIAFVSGKKGFADTITAIFVFVVINVLITPLKDLIILFRNSSNLDCANTAISVGNRLSCIIVDLWLFYFVVTVIAVAITLIFTKIVLPKIKGE